MMSLEVTAVTSPRPRPLAALAAAGGFHRVVARLSAKIESLRRSEII
jgi:hypothetical protein